MSESTTGQPLLTLSKVNKSFGAVHVLRDVDFSVRPGRVTALVGDNGAGKSTLIKGLAGIHAFDSGTTEATAAAVLMVLLLVVAAALGGYACLMAFGHATMVAECIFESESLGAPSRTPIDDPAAPFLETPEPKSTRAQSDGRPAWEDDDPVPLA